MEPTLRELVLAGEFDEGPLPFEPTPLPFEPTPPEDRRVEREAAEERALARLLGEEV